MPELPDVEGFSRVLREHVVGQRISSVVVNNSGVLRNVSPERLVSRRR
jgi:formamidopyrimidine-DNA glycosylase